MSMIREDGRGLSVHTFKALSLEYNGKPLNLHRCGTKVIMLLLKRLYHCNVHSCYIRDGFFSFRHSLGIRSYR